MACAVVYGVCVAEGHVICFFLLLIAIMHVTNAGGRMMKGISVAEFGAPDVMKLADIAKPEPKEGEVMLKSRTKTVRLMFIKKLISTRAY